MENTETIHVAPSGDLRILLFDSAESSKKRENPSTETHDVSPDEAQKTFIVSSAAMRLASPVWNTMLDPQGHSMESFSNGEVHFAEDDAAALLLILRIAHLQFRELPEFLDFHELVNLAVMCDKYDTTALVRPWIRQWKESLEKSSTLVEGSGREEFLFFAWTFGDLSTYEKIAKRLIYNSTCDGKGQLFVDNNVLGKNLPPGAIDCILEARKDTITALLEACSKLVQSYESDVVLCQAAFDDYRPRHRHYSGETQEETGGPCDTLMYGYLIKGLKKLGIWPGPISPSDVHRSVSQLMSDLRSIKCVTLDDSEHADCKVTRKLGKRIGLIDSDIPSGTDDPLRKHMEEQAKK